MEKVARPGISRIDKESSIFHLLPGLPQAEENRPFLESLTSEKVHFDLAMATETSPRPRFSAYVRSPVRNSWVDEEKERKFEEWKKKNAEKMRAANVKPKVYEVKKGTAKERDVSV